VLTTNLSAEVSRASAAEVVLRQNIMYINLLPCNPMVFSNALAPSVMPNTYYSNNIDGWYLKNTLANTEANWYIPPTGLTMGNINFMSFGFLPISIVSKPYITIYTAKTDTSNAGSWFGAKYVIDTYSSAPTAFTPTYCYGNVNSNSLPAPTIPGYSSLLMTSSGSNNLGSFLAGDQVIAISFCAGNTTSCAANSVEFILHEVNIISPSGTISNKFSNDSVVQAQSSNAISALYAYLFDSSNNTPPPVTSHSGFTSDPTLLANAMANYASLTGHVMSTYIPF
jgi:hypothetical protein